MLKEIDDKLVRLLTRDMSYQQNTVSPSYRGNSFGNPKTKLKARNKYFHFVYDPYFIYVFIYHRIMERLRLEST